MKRVRSDWQGAVLVCGKCSKKLDGGFGKKGRTPLAKLLRKILGLKTGRKAHLGVVETRCLGVCPRDAVALVDARRPGEWLVVPRHADVAELAAQLERPQIYPPAAVDPAEAGIQTRKSV
nr:(2Fe-2S) ferredoxin domain-containing protein [Sphingomonas insulae]